MSAVEPVGHDDETVFERRMRAVFLRNAGGTLKQVAEKLGVSTSQARKDVEAGLREYMKESAEQMIARQNSWVLDIVRANYNKMMGGDIDSGRLVLGAAERQSKLFGLDAPQRVSLGVNDYEYAERMAGLIRELGLAPPPELLAGLRRDADELATPPPGGDGDPPLDVELVGADEKACFLQQIGEPGADGDARTPDEKHAFDSQMGADGVVVTVVDDPGTLPVGDPPPTDLADLVDPPDAGPADDGWSNI